MITPVEKGRIVGFIDHALATWDVRESNQDERWSIYDRPLALYRIVSDLSEWLVCAGLSHDDVHEIMDRLCSKVEHINWWQEIVARATSGETPEGVRNPLHHPNSWLASAVDQNSENVDKSEDDAWIYTAEPAVMGVGTDPRLQRAASDHLMRARRLVLAAVDRAKQASRDKNPGVSILSIVEDDRPPYRSTITIQVDSVPYAVHCVHKRLINSYTQVCRLAKDQYDIVLNELRPKIWNALVSSICRERGISPVTKKIDATVQEAMFEATTKPLNEYRVRITEVLSLLNQAGFPIDEIDIRRHLKAYGWVTGSRWIDNQNERLWVRMVKMSLKEEERMMF